MTSRTLILRVVSFDMYGTMPRPKSPFHVSVERDEAGYYAARSKELPNAFTQARTLEQLKERMTEVIDLILEGIEEEHVKNPDRIIEAVA